MRVRHDLHVHSDYSDGWELQDMVSTATTIGLDGIGFADHCPLGPDRFGRRERYDLAETYRERRTELAAVTEEHDLHLYDAAEVNYDPDKEERIAEFLAEAKFDYTIGSVHFVDEFDIVDPDLATAAIEERHAAVERYVQWVIAMIESELFDIVGHLDLVQRDPVLQGLMDESQYVRIADALATSRTVPEINGGRLDRAYATIHPHPDRLPLFAERDIEFVLGSDAHAPDQLERRLGVLGDELDTLPVTITQQPSWLPV